MTQVKFDSAVQNDMGVLDVNPEEVLAKKEQIKIIDVRRPDEYVGELGHIAGSELLVLDTLPQRINELNKDETIVFVCRSGGRSCRAAAFAQSQGFKTVYNMAGGMIYWNDCELPVERE